MTWTRVARAQAGLITRRQLLATGLSATAVDNMLRRGRLDPTIIDGVYRVAGAPDTQELAAWYAALSTRSPVSYLSAARWWDMSIPDDGLVHVTRFDRRRLDWPPGVRVHRVAISREAITRHRGLWVTTASETALDCMGWLPLAQARTFADRAVQQRWLTLDDAEQRLRDQPGRWGNRQIRRLLTRIGDGAAAESERRLHRLLHNAGITGWVANLPFVVGAVEYQIDVAFPAQKIAIEVDGYAYHSEDGRFQADRTKQNALIGAGWRILRFTWADLVERPGYVIAQIVSLLAAKPAIA